MYFLSEKVGFHCYVSLPKGSSPDIMSVKQPKHLGGSERFGSSHGISTIKTSSGCRGGLAGAQRGGWVVFQLMVGPLGSCNVWWNFQGLTVMYIMYFFFGWVGIGKLCCNLEDELLQSNDVRVGTHYMSIYMSYILSLYLHMCCHFLHPFPPTKGLDSHDEQVATRLCWRRAPCCVWRSGHWRAWWRKNLWKKTSPEGALQWICLSSYFGKI